MVSGKTMKILAVAAIAVAAAACKKNEETTTLPSLEGRVTFSIDRFIGINEKVTMTASGAINPSGGEITYTWAVNPAISESDEDDETGENSSTGTEFTLDFGDRLRTYTVTCSASASGYYGISSSRSTTVVRPGLDGEGSITGIDISGLESIAAENGGKYYYRTIGGLDWFVQNLADKEPVSPDTDEYGIPYGNVEVMSDIFGRYYSYNEAVKACPDGWRLPTESEWEECLETAGNQDGAAGNQGDEGFQTGMLMADVHFNGEKMWEFWPEVKITDSKGFSAMPVGYANMADRSFSGMYERAAFWVAPDSGNEEGTTATVKWLYMDNPQVQTFTKADKESFGASVRCVRERQGN